MSVAAARVVSHVRPAGADGPIASVIIPAHDEETVIGRCLDTLFDGVPEGALEVIVVANGCRDRTAQHVQASGHPVSIIELSRGSKAAALRAGDAAATCYPRIYLDADVELSGTSAMRVIRRLRSGSLAARPPILYDASRSTPLVRSYYRARSRMPTVISALWGAGAYGVSEAGRARFGTFPDLVGDDLWVDRHFRPEEIEIVPCAPVRVTVPRTGRDLLAVLRRTYRGKAEPAPTAAPEPESSTAGGAVRDLLNIVRHTPLATRDVLVYAGFAVAGRLSDRAKHRTVRWERDASSRMA